MIPNGKRTVSGAYKMQNGEKFYLKKYFILFFCVSTRYLSNFQSITNSLKTQNRISPPSESIPPHCVLHTGHTPHVHMYVQPCCEKKIMHPFNKKKLAFYGHDKCNAINKAHIISIYNHENLIMKLLCENAVSFGRMPGHFSSMYIVIQCGLNVFEVAS